MNNETAAQRNRRLEDMGADRLFTMLEEENDASKRALLLILSNLNTNLVANTAATESIRKDLTTHLNSYQSNMAVTTEYINKGKGAWKVFAWVIGLAQALLVFTVSSLRSDITTFQKDITTLRITNGETRARIQNLERKIP